MIKTETITINGKTFYKSYSDAGYYIHGGSPESDYEIGTRILLFRDNVWAPGVYGWEQV